MSEQALTVQELGERLFQANPDFVVKNGFGRAHTPYNRIGTVAFEPKLNVTVKDMADTVVASLASTLPHYGGGEFWAYHNTPCYLGGHGPSDTVVPITLKVINDMLGDDIAAD